MFDLSTPSIVMGLFIGLLVGIIVMIVMSRLGLNRDKQRAQLILDEADAKAKNTIKQAVLDGKTQVYDLKLQAEKERIKNELQKFKNFWRKLIKHFQKKIGFDKDEKYKYVSDDLYRNAIFDDNDNQIANDVRKTIKTTNELNNAKTKKKNNMELK